MRLINCRTWILLGAVVMNDSAYAAFPSLDSDGNFNSGVGTLTLQFTSGGFNTASGHGALFLIRQAATIQPTVPGHSITTPPASKTQPQALEQCS